MSPPNENSRPIRRRRVRKERKAAAALLKANALKYRKQRRKKDG